MKRSISTLLAILFISNIFFSKSYAEDAQLPTPPIMTDQDKRDELFVYQKKSQVWESIESAKKIASTTGMITKLDENAIDELNAMFNRKKELAKKYLVYSQLMADSLLKCSQDLSLPTSELEKCVRNYRMHSANVAIFRESIGIWNDYILKLMSAQSEIEALANAYLANLKRASILCAKGKLVKKISGTNPTCPTGYKLKK